MFDTTHLPDEPALLKATLTEVLVELRESRRHGEHLQARLDQLLRRLYGPRAERWDPNQPLLFPDSTTPAQESATPPTAALPPASVAPTKRKGPDRQPLPRHLPRERRVYALSAAERACPCWGQERAVIGEEKSEQLD